MRSALKPLGFWVTTIETGLVTQGVPDFNYMHTSGFEGWCECKATSGRAVELRPMQIGFHLRRHRYGGTTWIAIRRMTRGGVRAGAPVDELWMVPGRYAAELSDEGLDCGRAIFLGDGGPAHWRWMDVAAHLCTAAVEVVPRARRNPRGPGQGPKGPKRP
jgi:hypothetical protein